MLKHFYFLAAAGCPLPVDFDLEIHHLLIKGSPNSETNLTEVSVFGVGTEIRMTCQQPYLAAGVVGGPPEYITCLSNGSWSDDSGWHTPTCYRKSCPKLLSQFTNYLPVLTTCNV